MNAVPRVATVSLNAAIDQTANVPDFTAGAVNRVAWAQADAGGKGVNVAAFLAGFNHAVAVTGLLGEGNTDLFVRLFTEKGLIDRFVRVPGHTRVNVKIVDDLSNRVTDINFPGVAARPADLDAVIAVIEDLVAQGCEWFVLSGSLPEGLPTSCYRDLTRLLKARGRKVVLDTSGTGLAQAIESGPDIIKPNIDELTELVGQPLSDERGIIEAAGKLRRQGIGLVAISMGADGAIFVDGASAVHATPAPVTVKSTVGAGDAMVAGIVHAQTQRLPLEECARLATAFSLGALGEIGPRLPPRDEIEGFCSRVMTRQLAT
ncbi:MAG: 1-phosphofructokinase [Rhodospirillales bacterium]|nr:1-phosphofructokinase [Rhodospirillales bacterium]